MAAFPFTVSAVDGAARTGALETPRGVIRTPAFMPVGTAGTVKALTVDQVKPASSLCQIPPVKRSEKTMVSLSSK